MTTGFSFGAKTTAPAFGATNTLSFGAAPTTNQFSFGSNTQQQQQQQQSGGFQLGMGLNKPTGSVAPQPVNLSFGASTSAPSAGFGFGATTSTAAPTGTGLSFGVAPASTAATTGFNLGTNPASTTSGLAFGCTPPGINFGALQTTATNLTLGARTASTTSSSNFGTPASTTSSFGLGTGNAQTGSFASTSTATGLNLSAPLGGTSTGLLFGGSSAASTTPGFSLGGINSSAAPTPALNFGTSTTGSILTSTPSTGLTFGATTIAPTLNFGATSTSAAPGGLSFGTSTASTGFTLNTAVTSTAPPEKVGLGGIQTSTATSLGTTTAKEVPPKEQQVPNEIQQDIENFKNYTKQQKLYSSDVSRCCVKDFRSVEAQIGVLNNVIKEIESQLQRNRSLAEKLKYDTAQGLQLLEMAQRTQDTPSGLQYENVAPMNFFLNLADNFEKEMHALKIQIENTDKYVKNIGQPATLTSQDLSLGMKRLHDTFVALAGRLQSVHTQVESQKELYINLRKQLANDFSNPFESLDKKLNPNQTISSPLNHSPPKIACGPTPFNQIISNFPNTAQPNVGSPYPGVGGVAPGGFSFGTSTLPSLFGNTFNKTNQGFQNTTLGTGLSFPNTNSSFQLQKPPTGNKRGKQ
ncbi:hypothetical protein HHI36_010836 [Cryptolaemus montrouzieri]|uniref:Nucleoporin p58/p45 n=1 Tax=Cryptolaemus montrouzieri TaxID=559131 RepID=A0ABD2MK11_9CUCU